MTSKLVVNTIEADTGISSVSFASSISMDSTAKFHFSAAGVDIGADTNINRPAAGVLAFNINSSEKARIDSSGYLIAKADIRLRRTASNNGALYFGDSNNNYIFGSDADDVITFATAGSERFRITSGGLVGIGTDIPAKALEVTSNTVPQFQVGMSNNSARASLMHNGSHLYFDTTTGDQVFRTGSTSERLRITSGGNVGINTDFTGSQTWRAGKILEIFGGGGNVTGELHLGANRGDGTQSVGSINFFDNTQDSTHRHIAIIEADKHGSTSNKRGGALLFYTKPDNVAAPVERLRITSGGQVIISNSNPPSSGAMTHVTDDGSATTLGTTSTFRVSNNGGNAAYSVFEAESGSGSIRLANDGKFYTTGHVDVGGVLTIQDNNSIFFGSSQDIEMRHNATSSRNEIIGKNHNLRILSNGTLELQCFQSTNSSNGNVLTATYNGGTALYYQNGERLITQNAGCKISSDLNLASWLHLGKHGGYTANASIGHTNTALEGIFWHSTTQYSIARSVAAWSNPYAQLTLDWPTGIRIDGGSAYGLSGARFHCHTMPTTNNNFDLGTSALRWRDVYCNQGAFNNSDIELKQDIASLTAAEMKAAKRLSALFKTYRWKDAVEEKGTDKARTHTGMIAQQIKTEMETEGLDATKYGLFGIDEWYENDKKEVITLDQLKNDIPDPFDSSKTISPMSTVGYTKVTRYSVRYTELLSFIAAYNDQRFADLESRVSALEGS